MSGYHVLQIPTEELKEHAILTLLEYFISDCRVLVEAGEGEAHNIAKSQKILSEHISDSQKLSTISLISAWHLESTMTNNNNSCYERGKRLFARGRLVAVINFLEDIRSQFKNLFTKSDYHYNEPLACLQKISEFEKTFPANSAKDAPYFTADIDDLFSELGGSIAQKINPATVLGEIHIAEFEKMHQDLSNILNVYFLAFISHLKERCIRASAFCIDMIARETNPSIGACYLSTDEQVKGAIQKLSQYCGNVKDILDFVNKDFQVWVSEAVEIDAIPVSNVQRIAYFCQGLDKAVYFSKGYCLGGIRDWVNNPTVQETGKRELFTQYQHLHNFSVTANIYNLQSNQTSFYQLNKSGDHFVFQVKNFSKNISFITEDKTPKTQEISEFIDSMINDLNSTATPYLLSQGYTPVFEVVLSNSLKKGDGHAIGFKFTHNGSNVIGRFRDLNSGEFGYGSIEVLKAWMKPYYVKSGLYALFDSYTIHIMPTKNKSKATFLPAFNLQLENTKHAKNQVIQQAIRERKDNQKREAMIKNYNLASEDENPVELFSAALKDYREIGSKEREDHIFAAWTILTIIGEFEDVDPKTALLYIDKAMAILDEYAKMSNHEGWDYDFLLGFVYFYKGVLPKSIHGTIGENEYTFFQKWLKCHESMPEKGELTDKIKQGMSELKVLLSPTTPAKAPEQIYHLASTIMHSFADQIGQLFPESLRVQLHGVQEKTLKVN